MNFMRPPMVCWGQRTGQLTICATAKIKKDFLSPVCSNAHKMETQYMAGKQVGARVQEIKQPDHVILSELRWQCDGRELHEVQSYSINVLFAPVRILINLLITYERTWPVRADSWAAPQSRGGSIWREVTWAAKAIVYRYDRYDFVFLSPLLFLWLSIDSRKGRNDIRVCIHNDDFLIEFAHVSFSFSSNGHVNLTDSYSLR